MGSVGSSPAPDLVAPPLGKEPRSISLLSGGEKTMTATADCLHGVTHRESGVSTRISIQLDDVTEDGNFKESANPNDDDSQDSPAELPKAG